ncbi:MAG: hypothetical protein WC365_09120 [Candidatus Babeliales bacterium]
MTTQCPYCTNEYETEKQLQSHIAANHWKIVHPDKRGKAEVSRR